MAGSEAEIQLADLIELDEAASPLGNAQRARQQAEFHAREVRELDEMIAVAPAADRAGDPRQAERMRHRELELLCREIAAAFDWLAEKLRPSRDLDLGLEHVRAGYEMAPEIVLLRRIAETQYPLLTAITLVRQNGVGLLTETRLSLKHAARGRALSDELSFAEAEQLFAGWLNEAAEIGSHGSVHLLAVCQAIEWLAHLAAERARPDHARALEDDLEATIYLARGTLDATGFVYAGPEDPAPGY